MTPEVGQVWRDLDKRMGGRLLWIDEVGPEHVRYVSAYTTPNGYERGMRLPINNRIAIRRLRHPFYQKVWPA